MRVEYRKKPKWLITFVDNMIRNYKTTVLLIACIIVVGVLSLIQYYLVGNTYQLLKDKYYSEVKREMLKIENLPAMIPLEQRAADNIERGINLYINKQIRKEVFFKVLRSQDSMVKINANAYLSGWMNKNSNLHSVNYKCQYESIIIDFHGKYDTLMSSSERPIVFIGTPFPASNAILLNQVGTTTATKAFNDNGGKVTLDHKYKIRRSSYIDVSGWEKEGFKRMEGIFLLAAGLIIAVIGLFYFVFSALVKQKKIAEIKTDFANNITHELKTPLSSIDLILKSIKRKEVQTNPALLKDLLHSLSRQHEKIQKIVDNVLESAMSGSIELKREKLDITKYLNQYTRDLNIKDHSLKTDIEPGRQILTTNIDSLEKILNILIENAMKYSGKGLNIYLKAYSNGTHYFIEVKDEGPGIAPEYKYDIFDKFFRIPEQNKHTVKGLGLGLYLAKQATISLDAKLTLNSRLGEGSAFLIQLPL